MRKLLFFSALFAILLFIYNKNSKIVNAEIGFVPRILEYLEAKEMITTDQTQDIISKSRLPDYVSSFFGDIAVKEGYITKETLNIALEDLCKKVSIASKKDIAFVFLHNKSMALPEYMKEPYFGNNGKINVKLKEVGDVDGAMSAANIAKLIVVMVLQDPKIINQDIVDGANGAADLAMSILDKDISALKNHSSEWIKKSKYAFQNLSSILGYDKALIDKYIENRYFEIEQVVNNLKFLNS